MDLQIFDYKGKEIRTIEKDGVTWWVLKDVCSVLGLSDTNKVSERLDIDELTRIKFVSGGQNRKMLCVNESGLYSVILRSDKEEAKPFRKWVTSEVLPTIRKHGAYMTPEKLEEVLLNPDMMIKLLMTLKEEQEKTKALENDVVIKNQQIMELKPKASYYDLILNCKDLISTTVIAKDYGWTAKDLNLYLSKAKVQFKQGGIWLLYQKYAKKGYTSTKTYNYSSKDGTEHMKVHTYWTQKGRLFIYHLLKNKGVLPLIERRNRRTPKRFKKRVMN